nr:MAG TPA_asm: hypothetical protein [Caudoviricetes sp.]
MERGPQTLQAEPAIYPVLHNKPMVEKAQERQAEQEMEDLAVE